jgi:hypothetical protein
MVNFINEYKLIIMIHTCLSKPKNRALVLFPPSIIQIICALCIILNMNIITGTPPYLYYAFLFSGIWLTLGALLVFWSDCKSDMEKYDTM